MIILNQRALRLREADALTYFRRISAHLLSHAQVKELVRRAQAARQASDREEALRLMKLMKRSERWRDELATRHARFLEGSLLPPPPYSEAAAQASGGGGGDDPTTKLSMNEIEVRVVGAHGLPSYKSSVWGAQSPCAKVEFDLGIPRDEPHRGATKAVDADTSEFT